MSMVAKIIKAIKRERVIKAKFCCYYRPNGGCSHPDGTKVCTYPDYCLDVRQEDMQG